MAKRPKRIHVNRSDAWIVVALVVLISGMTFTVGMLLGFGFGETRGVEAYIASLHHAEGQEHAAPIEEEALEIVEAFKNSKQEALNVLLSQQMKNQAPKSIADAKAYFDKQSEDVPEAVPEENLGTRSPASQGNEKINRIPAAIKPLFEMAADDVKTFSPTSEEWTIQIASYPSRDQAESKLLDLRKSKVIDAYVKDQVTQDGAKWFSVFVGSHKDKQWSSRVASRLKRRNLIESYHIKKVP